MYMYHFLQIILILEGNLFQISFHYQKIVKLQNHKNSSICCFLTGILPLNRFQILLNLLRFHFINRLLFSIEVCQECTEFQLLDSDGADG